MVPGKVRTHVLLQKTLGILVLYKFVYIGADSWRLYFIGLCYMPFFLKLFFLPRTADIEPKSIAWSFTQNYPPSK
jgi:hypothetical protein